MDKAKDMYPLVIDIAPKVDGFLLHILLRHLSSVITEHEYVLYLLFSFPVLIFFPLF